MTYMQALLGFALVAGSMALVPGLDMMMVLHETINTSRRRGIAAAWGISFGVLVWAVAAAVGLAALINAFPMAYDAIRVVGGLYLFYLAFSMARKKKSNADDMTVKEVDTDAGRQTNVSRETSLRESPTFGDCAQSFFRGFLTDFFNPKIGVFYIAIIPQFLVPGVGNLQMGVSLGLIHFVESILVLTTVSYAAAFFAGRLRNERSQRILGLISGAIMAVLGGVTIADVVKSRL
ncbi:LysE family translocator [Bifidobacterium sp. SMB2]|uniref:LysE family translocator n=1 Tax=Bifidobacterium saimiriisciurei TaxID=2661627 RepID=A0ABX0C981_9BIFI|nr:MULTISPECIES: LysE family translocator [Bifidobacterium]NEG95541.1 LysE family translocator [Bifidobacterium sp. SMB2]NEH11699.1 LysE family translocator [Bifidobacterium saimiriisciurei]